jgi:hypothetical protein
VISITFRIVLLSSTASRVVVTRPPNERARS